MPRESMCMAGEARARAACVSSVLCTRVLVCKAQRSERGRGSGEAEASEARCATCLKSFSRNREIGKSENRETASRAYDFLREAWCSCDAAAAECQLRRVIDTLTGASFSRTRTAAIYKAVAQAVVGVESGSKSGLGLLQCKRVQHIRRPHGVKQNLTRRKKAHWRAAHG